jgi:uncharacterized HAD superfamily protein
VPTSTRSLPPPDEPPDAPRPPAKHYPADTFVTTAQLIADTLLLIPYLARRVQAICAIPRSGLLPAALLAEHLHLPLYSVHAGIVIHTGHGARLQPNSPHTPRVALIDDTAQSGSTMAAVWPTVAHAFGCPPHRITVYTSPLAAAALQHYAAILPGYHFLEWNIFNAGMLHRRACDLDGVLCEEIPPHDIDEGPRYAAAIANAWPKNLPRRHPIPLIITGRLERWRDATHAWLERHGLRYDRLLMGPWKSADERDQDWPLRVSRFKATAYAKSNCELFIESDPQQAQQIATLTGKPVLCSALPKLLNYRA